MTNPFNDIIEAMREEGKYYNEPSFYFAKVVSSYPNLKVKFNDMIHDRNTLQIDKFLLDRCTSFNTDSSDGHTHSLNKLTDLLKVGDEVVLIRNNNKFVIISKVVNI